MLRPASFALLILTACLSAQAAGPTLIVQIPDKYKVQSAVATAAQLKLDIPGKVEGQTLTFADLLPDTPYNLKLTLADGTILQGADMSWYGVEPAKSKEPLDDDDLAQIKEVYFGHQGFENKRNILALEGTHERAVLLAELIRDSAFHSDSGGEIIWRVELWYYKNQHGGWEKINQVNKILRRERFKGKAPYDADAGKLKWFPELGGLKIPKGETKKTLTVTLEKKEFLPGDKPKPKDEDKDQ